MSVSLEEFINRYNGCTPGEILEEEVSVAGLYANGHFILILLLDLACVIILSVMYLYLESFDVYIIYYCYREDTRKERIRSKASILWPPRGRCQNSDNGKCQVSLVCKWCMSMLCLFEFKVPWFQLTYKNFKIEWQYKIWWMLDFVFVDNKSVFVYN